MSWKKKMCTHFVWNITYIHNLRARAVMFLNLILAVVLTSFTSNNANFTASYINEIKIPSLYEVSITKEQFNDKASGSFKEYAKWAVFQLNRKS